MWCPTSQLFFSLAPLPWLWNICRTCISWLAQLLIYLLYCLSHWDHVIFFRADLPCSQTTANLGLFPSLPPPPGTLTSDSNWLLTSTQELSLDLSKLNLTNENHNMLGTVFTWRCSLPLGGDGHYQMSALGRSNRWECSGLDYLPVYLFRRIQGHFWCLWKPEFQCTALEREGNTEVEGSAWGAHEMLSSKMLKLHKQCMHLFV